MGGRGPVAGESLRTVSTKTNTALGQPVTQPVVLVELHFSTILRYSSRQQLTWDNKTWGKGRLSGFALSEKESGGIDGTVNIVNNDGVITSFVFNEGASGREVNIWYLYGDSPYVLDDALQVFSGIIDGVDIGDLAQINIISDGLIQWTPRIAFSQDRFSHMQPKGSQVTWGNEKFILE